MSVAIRPYQAADRAGLREVCLAAGLRGRDIRHWLDHPDIWADIWTAAYVEREPENCWVVCDDGAEGERVVGYLVATADTEASERYFTRAVLPRIAGRAIFRGHWLSGKDRTFFARTIRAMRRGELSLPPGVAREYPGHFHFNLLAGFRGAGLGGRLYDLFVTRMRDLNVPGVNSQVMTANQPVVDFHHRRGYAEVFRSQAKALSNYFEQGPVELAVFVKKL